MTKENEQFSVPILINIYKSKERVGNLIAALAKVEPSKIYIFQDGGDSPDDDRKLDECLAFAKEKITWPCKIKSIRNDSDVGSAAADVIALRWIFSFEDKGIFMEDDQIPTPGFFRYCAFLLDEYQEDKSISYISSANPYEKFGDQTLDYFYSTRGSLYCWGTWKRFVDLLDDDYSWVNTPNAERIFRKSADRYTTKQTFKRARRNRGNGKIDIEIEACAATVYNSMFCIVPTKNMVKNTGVDAYSQNGSKNIKLIPRRNQKQMFMKTYEPSFPPKGPNEIKEEEGFIDFYNSTWLSRLTLKISVHLRKLFFSGKK